MGTTAENLRESILQYAVEGKLVPQNTDEEPASVLLNRIRTEKEQLARNREVRRDLLKSEIYRKGESFFEKIDGIESCIDEQIPFEIPSNWEWTRLGSILTKLTDGTHSTPKYKGNGIPFISVKDISSGKLDFTNCKYISEEEHKTLYARCNPEYGDLLLTKVGTTGIPVIVDTESQFSLFVSVALLKFNQKEIYNKFLLYMIGSPLVQNQATENTRGVGNKNWVISDISNTLIVVPPLEEQRRIVKELEKLEPLFAEYECLEKELSNLDGNIHDKLWKSILQYALEGKLVSQNTEEGTAATLVNKIYAEKRRLGRDGTIKKTNSESVIYRDSDGRYCEKKNNGVTDVTDEIPFDIPESWVWGRLDDIVAVNPRNILPDGQESSFVEMSAIKEGYCGSFTYVVKPWGKIKSGYTHFRDGDVGFAKITPCFQNRKSVVFRNLKNGYGAGTTELNILRPYGETILPEYLLWFVKSPYFIQRGISNLSGTAGQQRFGTDNVKSTLIPIPPYEEQKRIVDEIEKYESLLDGLGELV